MKDARKKKTLRKTRRIKSEPKEKHIFFYKGTIKYNE
jgi:hypothetical protein